MTVSAPSMDIKDILDDSSYFTANTNLFVADMPDTPDECVCVFDTGGLQPNAMIAGEDYPRVMVHVRGKKWEYEESYANCRLVLQALHRKVNYIVDSSTRIISIISQHDPMFLGYDEKERPTWSMNFQINRSTN